MYMRSSTPVSLTPMVAALILAFLPLWSEPIVTHAGDLEFGARSGALQDWGAPGDLGSFSLAAGTAALALLAVGAIMLAWKRDETSGSRGAGALVVATGAVVALGAMALLAGIDRGAIPFILDGDLAPEHPFVRTTAVLLTAAASISLTGGLFAAIGVTLVAWADWRGGGAARILAIIGLIFGPAMGLILIGAVVTARDQVGVQGGLTGLTFAGLYLGLAFGMRAASVPTSTTPATAEGPP